MLLILEDLKKSRETTQSNLDLSIEFPESDTRLSVTPFDNNTLAGSLALPSTEAVEVVCDPIKEELMRFGEKGPRHVLIYARLSANTLVHPFYGIAQRYGAAMGCDEIHQELASPWRCDSRASNTRVDTGKDKHRSRYCKDG